MVILLFCFVAFKTWKRFSDEKGKLTCYLLFHFRQMQHPCGKSTGWCGILSLYSLPVGLSNITADLPCGAITSNTAGKHQIMHLLALFISFDTQESWFPSVWLLYEFGITSPIEKITGSISVSGQLPTYPSPNSTTVNW